MLKLTLTPNSTAESSPSKWTELIRLPLSWGLEMSSTSTGYCSSAFMNTEVCDVSQYSQLFANQASCFSRITSFPPTVNPPLQMSGCHCATVLQSFLAVLWFWSRCPPLLSDVALSSTTLLKLHMSSGLPCWALWHQPKGSSAASGFSIFQKLPAFPGLWPLPPTSKAAVMGQVLFTLHLHDPLFCCHISPLGHMQERFYTLGNLYI